ncbi:MAG: hypothetical protein JJU28_19340 [Cyclobacteriaceae bacterium]|nr:hypothetical protein [Cyclobacteriaceae bacterium]
MSTSKKDNSHQANDKLSKEKKKQKNKRKTLAPKDPDHNKKSGKGIPQEKAREDQVLARINSDQKKDCDTPPKRDNQSTTE